MSEWDDLPETKFMPDRDRESNPHGYGIAKTAAKRARQKAGYAKNMALQKARQRHSAPAAKHHHPITLRRFSWEDK